MAHRQMAIEQDIDDRLLPCSFKFHKFVIAVSDVTVNCHVIKMDNCLFLWIGHHSNPAIEDLSLALDSDFEKLPIATKIMGSVADATSVNIAKRLSKKIGKPVYVSFNVTADRLILPEIEKQVQEEFQSQTLLKF